MESNGMELMWCNPMQCNGICIYIYIHIYIYIERERDIGSMISSGVELRGVSQKKTGSRIEKCKARWHNPFLSGQKNKRIRPSKHTRLQMRATTQKARFAKGSCWAHADIRQKFATSEKGARVLEDVYSWVVMNYVASNYSVEHC